MTSISTPRLGRHAGAERVARPSKRVGTRRPHLEVVVPGRATRATRRRRARVVAVMASIVVAAALFGLVAANVVLTQHQFALETLEEKAAAEQARYERLRLQVAELEAPERIVATAQERLGMVPPATVTYLSPTGPSTQAPTASGVMDDSAPGTWSRVKPHLSGRR